MAGLYEMDVLAWSIEQARLLRERRWSALDIENLAEEIEDVGNSVRHELGSRIAALIAALLKWQLQPELRSDNWRALIDVQRDTITRRLGRVPSLISALTEEDWLKEIWNDALVLAIKDTGLHAFPDTPLWTSAQILAPAFLPA
ncbi:DUF29 domain-containing protein [Massilia sp. P8910]|uniref:DUF29 domain-containing protein n=1 Tax=Massilia antarctica TaxID=2765360 RepID=UPI0006BB82A9|nr:MULTISPECIES: DUF29 domain-containing protein [Massilia]MCE3608314.1 DUF29 domain-containing protein [Massilia antarctica]MCY0912116.1 DUF29 domain-containing protein [Massilia sp. H27-R4]CUI06412.1 hypothetical protein BN2497_7601 [Janthinobacterium sp. CG23_2]CUU30198.1 hypothetical protein BN3177_7601 [Janthinobacterium sp. CG23_2]